MLLSATGRAAVWRKLWASGTVFVDARDRRSSDLALHNLCSSKSSIMALQLQS